MNTLENFRIDERIIIVTGGAGLLGRKHAEAILDGGGIPVLIDISEESLNAAKNDLTKQYGDKVILTYTADITSYSDMERIKEQLKGRFGRIDGLINNAANNPKVEGNPKNMQNVRFESFPLSIWLDDISVGLTGALVCSQIFGMVMAEQRKGIILNISSDLGIIAPDQRIYRESGVPDQNQNVKPVTYSVIKHGLIGLTKYLATYWAEKGVRANSLCPGGIYNGQNEEFLHKLTNLIPMGRMARKDEYKSTVLYMLSDASSYMTGSTIIVDGGRTCW